MPAFAKYYGDDYIQTYSAQTAWQIWANHATTAWYQATDPIGLQKRFATS